MIASNGKLVKQLFRISSTSQILSRAATVDEAIFRAPGFIEVRHPHTKSIFTDTDGVTGMIAHGSKHLAVS